MEGIGGGAIGRAAGSGGTDECIVWRGELGRGGGNVGLVWRAESDGSNGGAIGGRAIGGIVIVRDNGAVLIRTAAGEDGSAGTPRCVPCGARARGSGATSPAPCGADDVIRGMLTFLGAENIRSSEGSFGSGFWVVISSMSSLTAVDSFFAIG